MKLMVGHIKILRKGVMVVAMVVEIVVVMVVVVVEMVVEIVVVVVLVADEVGDSGYKLGYPHAHQVSPKHMSVLALDQAEPLTRTHIFSHCDWPKGDQVEPIRDLPCIFKSEFRRWNSFAFGSLCSQPVNL